MEHSPLAQAIFAYDDKKSKRIDFCGNQVLVVAPTMGAMPGIFKGILKDGTKIGDDPEAIEINELDLPGFMAAAPDIMIHCVREPANRRIHVFQDDKETREMLADVPYDESLKVVKICLELMGLDKAQMQGEIKNS